MQKKNTNYNKMAPFYNVITNLISEGGNIRSQRYFLQYINENDKVLNIGCGSVQFNVDIAKKSKNVTSIDIASKMIDIAKKNVTKKNLDHRVKFICNDIMKHTVEEKYDVILVNFMLNTFEWEYAKEVLEYICGLLQEEGILCIADEHVATKPLHKLFQNLFRPSISWIHHIWAGHPIHNIYDYYPVMKTYGYNRVKYKIDKSNVISSSIFKKIK